MAQLYYKSGSSWVNALSVFYPVGAYYLSNSSSSPSSLFGGTWQSVTSRFLYCSSSITTGGENSHTLTINEMPSHKHGIRIPVGTSSSRSGLWLSNITDHINDPVSADGYVQHNGGGAAHNNMPQYRTCFAWYRTA